MGEVDVELVERRRLEFWRELRGEADSGECKGGSDEARCRMSLMAARWRRRAMWSLLKMS